MYTAPRQYTIMDVKEAVRLAKKHIIELFEDDDISHVGLEEVEFDELFSVWKITIGFHRPTGLLSPLEAVTSGLSSGFSKGTSVRRAYKIVNIKDRTGKVLSVKHRALGTTD